MTEPQRDPGSVADEAARLVEAFLAMTREAADGAGGPRHRREPSPTHQPVTIETSTDACPDCGAVAGTTPAECRLCPVCQGIALLGRVRPEALERLADLAGVVSTGLRELATSSRARGMPGQEPDDAPVPLRRATVQDIPVEDHSSGQAARPSDPARPGGGQGGQRPAHDDSEGPGT